MSEIAKQLFDSLKAVTEVAQAVAPGLKNFAADVTAEASRMGTQGSMELASMLFNGNGFVPYGPGQYTPSVDHPHETELASALFKGDGFVPYGQGQNTPSMELEHESGRER